MGDIQHTMQTLLDSFVASGAESGLQLAAYHHGELVVDAWAGVHDDASRQPVDGTTLFLVFSCSKGITATIIHLLAERGLIDYDAPVMRYWPAFGQAGKSDITIRHVLTHMAGVPQMPDGTTPETICDWDWMCSQIAQLEPLWEPGTKTGYHALTYGWILGEVARLVDGRPLSMILQQDICATNGFDGMFFGIPHDVESRVATLVDGPAAPDPPADALIHRAAPDTLSPAHAVYNRAEVRRACIPSANLITNARSLARFYGLLAGASSDTALLPPRRVAVARALQTCDVDLVLGGRRRKGMGYFLGDLACPLGFPLTTFGHPGAGGALGYADPAHRFSFALTKSRLVWVNPPLGDTAQVVSATLRAALGIPDALEMPCAGDS